MFTGFIDIDGNHIKDGLKNELSSTRLLKQGGWIKSSGGGYMRETDITKEFTILTLGDRPKSVNDWVVHQIWYSSVPHKPQWKRKLLACWLRLRDFLIKIVK